MLSLGPLCDYEDRRGERKAVLCRRNEGFEEASTTVVGLWVSEGFAVPTLSCLRAAGGRSGAAGTDLADQALGGRLLLYRRAAHSPASRVRRDGPRCLCMGPAWAGVLLASGIAKAWLLDTCRALVSTCLFFWCQWLLGDMPLSWWRAEVPRAEETTRGALALSAVTWKTSHPLTPSATSPMPKPE